MGDSSSILWLQIYDPDGDKSLGPSEEADRALLTQRSETSSLEIERVQKVEDLMSPCQIKGCQHAEESFTPAPTASPQREQIIQVIQNEVDTKRIAVVKVETLDDSYVMLQQQEWAAGIGWFTQRSIELEPAQLGPLRCTLQLCGECRSKADKRMTAAAASRLGLGTVS